MDDKFFLALIDKFNSSEITELDFNDGNVRLALRKANAQNTAGTTPLTVEHGGVSVISSSKAAPQTGQNLVEPSPAAQTLLCENEKIISPIVAVFYSSPGPDAPAFVKPGTKVKAGQTLCILEAMKMMNHLDAEFDCEIIEVHADNGKMVEYGQEIFTVKRN
ncbi:MAG: acetyl-CoA carboxylase biotin carboxyl carrier protein [Treponema sp.]|nr:acetyl-CoA carboxylase biotin carboxyl carrier protein [Treponema sp.]